MDGLHENMCNVKYSDPLFEKTSSAIDWLAWGDVIDHASTSRMDMLLGAYSPFAAVGVAQACRCPQAPELQFPRAAQNCRQQQMSAKGVLDSLIMGMSASTVCNMSKRAICTDLLSLLNKVRWFYPQMLTMWATDFEPSRSIATTTR